MEAPPAPDDLSRLHAYDDLTARIWRDKRCTPGPRELLLAIAWVIARDSEYDRLRSVSDKECGRYLWQQMAVMLGADRGRPRYKQLVADDAPRYEPPNTWPDRACEAPRLRTYRPRTTTPIQSPTCLIGKHPHLGACRYTAVHSEASAAAVKQPAPELEPSEICGANPKLDTPAGAASLPFHLIERDPRTGWHIDHWFCSRHRDHYERVKTQLANAPEAPEPIPNRGGLLPCHFKADWARMYTLMRPHWTVPVYGIVADDWPGVISGGVTPRRPGFRLILGELADA